MPLALPFAALLQPFLPLLGRGVLPALAHAFTLFGREILEAAVALADALLLLGSQLAEAVPALSCELALFGRELLPAIEALLGPFALLGGHGLPATSAAQQALLLLGRHRVPLLAVTAEQFLLFGFERIPLGVHRRRRGRRLGAGAPGERELQSHGADRGQRGAARESPRLTHVASRLSAAAWAATSAEA